MDTDAGRQRSTLGQVARRAMIERGLPPDFSRAAPTEPDGIRGTAAGSSGAADKGTRARLLHRPLEGRLIHGCEGADVGDRPRVQPVRTDVERGYIDFKRVD